MDFLQFPIPDRGLPEPQAFAALALETLGELQAGTALGVHCRAEIGRSGLLACCILTIYGLAAAESLALVSRARGVTVPDTDAQAAFIHNIAAQAAAAE